MMQLLGRLVVFDDGKNCLYFDLYKIDKVKVDTN